jgi:hypothetical protein
MADPDDAPPSDLSAVSTTYTVTVSGNAARLAS